MFLMGISALLSIINVQISGLPFTWRDLMVVLQLAFYGVVLAGASMVELDEGEAKHFIVFLIGIGIVTSVVSFWQYFNLFNLNRIFEQLYRPDTTYLKENASLRRVIGTMENPNYWGLFISQILFVLTYLIIWKRKIFLIPLFLALLVSLIFTGSRTSIVSLIFGIFATTFMLTFFSKNRPNYLILIILVVVAIFASSYLIMSETYKKEDRFSLSNIKTFKLRVNHWEKVMNTVKHNIFFGIGPGKAIKETWVDNSFIKFLSEFGLLGLILYLFFIGQMLWFTISNLKHVNIFNADYLIIFMNILFGWIIFGFTTDAWNHARCAPIFLAFYGITKSIVSTKKSSL